MGSRAQITDRSQDQSRELEQVRDVRSKALSAAENLGGFAKYPGMKADPPDPDFEEMKAALELAAALLSRWAKG